MVMACILWVAACSTPGSSPLWLHLFFLATLLQVNYSSDQHLYRDGLSVLNNRLLESVPVALWTGLLVSGVFDRTALAVFSFAVCLPASLVALTKRDSYRRRHLSAVGKPSEENWYEWTAPQVVQWLQEEFNAMEDSQGGWVQSIAKEQIRGNQLERLSLQDWRSMGVPLGHALDVKDAIDDLTSRIPVPEQSDTEDDDNASFPVEEASDVVPIEMRQQQPTSSMEPKTQPNRQTPMPPHVAAILRQNPELLQRAMQKKPLNNRNNESIETKTLPSKQPSTADVSGTIIPPDLLASMTPHIAQVIQQNPELLQKAKEMRRQTMQHRRRKGPPIPFNRGSLPTVLEPSEEDEEEETALLIS